MNKHDFPTLNQTVRNNKPLVYLDNAATTQKPQCVIDAVNKYYTLDNANVHRGVHALSERATAAYESARNKIKNFINAPKTSQIIFTRGTTESINLVAQSYGHTFLKKGDEVIISAMEHHANIVPWQLLRDQIGIKLRIIPMDENGELQLDVYKTLFNSKTKFVSITHISNSIGIINPAKEIIKIAHDHNVPILIDGAQSVVHSSIDVQDLDCDFFVFSGHKLYGPTGIGVLYGKEKLLKAMKPYQGGGDMILSVTFDKTEFAPIPTKFEAGTPNIAGTIGLGVAIDYLQNIGMDKIAAHEHELLVYATEKLSKIKGLTIIGSTNKKASMISFVLEGIHPHDIGTLLDDQGIAIRAGHHCAMPVMNFFDVPATVRASLSFYNTKEEIDKLANAILKVQEIFS